MKNEKTKVAIIVSIFLLAGIAGGYFLGFNNSQKLQEQKYQEYQERTNSEDFILAKEQVVKDIEEYRLQESTNIDRNSSILISRERDEQIKYLENESTIEGINFRRQKAIVAIDSLFVNSSPETPKIDPSSSIDASSQIEPSASSDVFSPIEPLPSGNVSSAVSASPK